MMTGVNMLLASPNLARPPLAHVERRTQVSDSLSLGSGRQPFFSQKILQCSVVEHGVSQKLLQLGILALCERWPHLSCCA
jgi:hypothetical protein